MNQKKSPLYFNLQRLSVVSLGIFTTTFALAQTKARSTTRNSHLTQIPSVSQLSDIQPSDWAFGALQSLVERYGCIAGYPDATYRGNRALTRYEFAAGLNACLDRLLVSTLVSTENFGNPNNFSDNPNIYVGNFRVQFSF